ncbi:ribose 5-phosphate isomerase B [Zavarzinella formosa]|uniref:ribose 5-phosphate isomerase B n=1 Tax=Zavarzinella formosa TaxID=360055 RepID=UPI0002D8EEA2|nr:ribose 5-phosphate isomerase B [Zavarzinella formosa]
MKIALGSDHRGYTVKQRLIDVLTKAGHEIHDLGTTCGEAGVDYPDYAIPVSQEVAGHAADRGILVCGTGFGMCIVANKVHGVRAVTCRNDIEAEMSRRHNDANVLCMSADFLGQEQIDRMVNIWLATEFDAGRHLRRVEKITKYEEDHPGE